MICTDASVVVAPPITWKSSSRSAAKPTKWTKVCKRFLYLIHTVCSCIFVLFIGHKVRKETLNLTLDILAMCLLRCLGTMSTIAGRPALSSTTTSTTVSTVSTSAMAVLNTTTQAPAVIPTRTTTPLQMQLPVATSPRMPPHWKDVEIQSISVRTTTKKTRNNILIFLLFLSLSCFIIPRLLTYRYFIFFS